MENPIKMDDLGGFAPYFWFNTQMVVILTTTYDTWEVSSSKQNHLRRGANLLPDKLEAPVLLLPCLGVES